MLLGYTMLIVFTLWLVDQLCLTLCSPMDCSQPGSSVYGDSPCKNTGVGCHALLQGISPAQGLNPGLPHCRQILYHLSHQESPIKPWDSPGKNTGMDSHFLVWGIFLPSGRILVSYIASRFFTTVQPREA